MLAVSLFILAVVQNINANTGIPVWENSDANNSMLTMALFEKLNWMIREMKTVSHQLTNLKNGVSQLEYMRRLNAHAFKAELRERLEKQDVKTEKLFLQMQQEIITNLDAQENVLRNTSINVENLKSCDVASFKRNRNWQTILRRQDGSENFNRSWNEYKFGFGKVNGEYFVGLEALHAMTTYADAQELLIVLQDFDNQTRYAKYSDFMIGSESEKYKIEKIGNYQGDAGDSFSQHLYSKFSSYDQDNDNSTTSSCAQLYRGGWWFTNCYDSHLTGVYLRQPKMMEEKEKGLVWYSWHGLDCSLKYVEMMIRPK